MNLGEEKKTYRSGIGWWRIRHSYAGRCRIHDALAQHQRLLNSVNCHCLVHDIVLRRFDNI